MLLYSNGCPPASYTTYHHTTDVIMRLIIREDAEATSAYVANYIIDRIKAYNPTPQNPFVLGLPTGSSPLGVYKNLVEQYKAGKVSSESL